jgi:uncharacterized protein (UPF0548 family)
MRIFFRRPDDQKLAQLTREYHQHSVTCDDPGSTKAWSADMFEQMPNSQFVGDELWKFRREPIGKGLDDYGKAVDALRNARCFDLAWVTCVAECPFKNGGTFSLIVKAFGLWAVNFCRIIYIETNDTSDEKIVSIGIATLPVHAAVGEERLSVSMDQKTGQVDFLIGSHSKPSTFLSRLFAGYLRKRQDVFAVDATARMRRAVTGSAAASNAV